MKMDEKKAKSVRVKKDNHKGEVTTEPEYDTLQISPEALTYKTNFTTKYKNRKQWKRPDLQEIKSVIPGVVISFTVKEGDHVQKGSELMIFEAMKMMNVIRAPFDGTIEKILVNLGEKLPKGVIMIYLKSDFGFETEEDTISNALGLNE